MSTSPLLLKSSIQTGQTVTILTRHKRRTVFLHIIIMYHLSLLDYLLELGVHLVLYDSPYIIYKLGIRCKWRRTKIRIKEQPKEMPRQKETVKWNYQSSHNNNILIGSSHELQNIRLLTGSTLWEIFNCYLLINRRKQVQENSIVAEILQLKEKFMLRVQHCTTLHCSLHFPRMLGLFSRLSWAHLTSYVGKTLFCGTFGPLEDNAPALSGLRRGVWFEVNGSKIYSDTVRYLRVNQTKTVVEYM